MCVRARAYQKTLETAARSSSSSSMEPAGDDGARALRLSARSTLVLRPGALAVSPAEFAALEAFVRAEVPPSPNPRRPTTFLKRRQCTFVLPGARHYDFGQVHRTFESAASAWPPVVARALAHARAHAGADAAALYNGVHVNLYADASVGVAPHADKERSMVAGRTIFSYTLLADPARPRPFSVYTRDKATKLHDLPLGHGDLLEMRGAMQAEFTHGVETRRPASAYGARINLTVRAFLPAEAAAEAAAAPRAPKRRAPP
jgi:alkylated DNA repair dioxygenase AlkB